MIEFDFQPRTRIVFGPDRIDQLGELARELGAGRVLLVTDPGIVAAGHVEHGLRALETAALEVLVFDGVVENPTTDNVELGLAVARDFRPDVLVALGGGSSMDCCKGINFLYTNGGRMQDYWGVDKARSPMLPMIAVPTTAGTGSETQSFALISDAQTKVKMACGDKKASFRVAVLDPKLTVTMPPAVTALTGIDAIAHALETYVTRRRNSVSLAFSREAWRLLEPNFSRVLHDPQDLEARGGMLLGACFAGLAIENSMLGAAHALANPLTQHFGIVHGQAVAVALPHVIRFNAAEVGGWYRELLLQPGSNGSPRARTPDLHSGDELARRITRLVEMAGLKTQLRELGVPAPRLEELAAGATQQWTGTFNPRTLDQGDFLQLYRAAW